MWIIKIDVFISNISWIMVAKKTWRLFKQFNNIKFLLQNEMKNVLYKLTC